MEVAYTRALIHFHLDARGEEVVSSNHQVTTSVNVFFLSDALKLIGLDST